MLFSVPKRCPLNVTFREESQTYFKARKYLVWLGDVRGLSVASINSVLLEGSMPRFKTTTRTRVRVGPGTDTEEAGVIPAGRTVQVFDIFGDGKWYKVGGMVYIFQQLRQPVGE